MEQLKEALQAGVLVYYDLFGRMTWLSDSDESQFP